MSSDRTHRVGGGAVAIGSESLIDPDPFVIGLGIFGAIAGGGSLQHQIDAILIRLRDVIVPDAYRDLIRLAREIIGLYANFLERIGDREGFEADRPPHP